MSIYFEKTNGALNWHRERLFQTFGTETERMHLIVHTLHIKQSLC